MIIGIDINNTLRAYNEQAIYYYEKAFNTKVNLNHEKECDANLDEVLKFKSKLEKNAFFYETYPYEIFGCATTMETFLLPKLNEWIREMELKGNKVYIVSFGENILSMQSTMFFLSKIGVKCRYYIMPLKENELEDKIDVLVTANPKLFNKKALYNVIGVKRGYNKDLIANCDLSISNLEDLFNLQIELKEHKNNFGKLFWKKIKQLWQIRRKKK